MPNDKYEQLGLFDEEKNKKKCYMVETKKITYLNTDELFGGFDELKVLTYSFSIGFIAEICTLFKKVKIILGSSEILSKTGGAERIAAMLADGKMAGRAILQTKEMVSGLQDGSIVVRYSKDVVDHRKIYLLSAADGRTRVITPSANMSYTAWTTEQKEYFEYDDTEFGYRERLSDFEKAWSEAEDLTYSDIAASGSNDLISGNPFLNKNVDTAIVVKDINGAQKAVLDVTKSFMDRYQQAVIGSARQTKDGTIRIIPKKIIEKIRKTKEKEEEISIIDSYPKLDIDLMNETIKIDGVEVTMPAKEDVDNDIKNIFSLFDGFDEFCGTKKEIQRTKETHFRMMNVLFASPFFATLRCFLYQYRITTDTFPMFFAAISEKESCGKTMMIKSFLKLMTGKDVYVLNASECNRSKAVGKEFSSTDTIRSIQNSGHGFPFFIDEISTKFLTNLKAMIKNNEYCEKNGLSHMPAIVFASNDMIRPEGHMRKRMPFFQFSVSLSSEVDIGAFSGRGKRIVERLSNNFYKEYLLKMMKKIKAKIVYIESPEEKPDEYYVDLTKMASECILEIISEHGFDIPKYMKIMSWSKDYAEYSRNIFDDVIDSIIQRYKQNPATFELTSDAIIIDMGKNEKECKNWANSLPNDVKAKSETSRSGCQLVINDRKKFEQMSGYSFGNSKRNLKNIFKKHF